MGTQSVADRDDTVSVGAEGAERQVTNVAAGTTATDAVNVQQMSRSASDAVAAANDYTDTRVKQVQQDISRVERKGNAGSAAAMAMAGLPQAYKPGKGMLSAAGSTYRGATALAVGALMITEDGYWLVKANASVNNYGDVGASVGAGYPW